MNEAYCQHFARYNFEDPTTYCLQFATYDGIEIENFTQPMINQT